MKNKNIILVLALLLSPVLLMAQRDSEIIKKSFVVANNSKTMWFGVCNIQGDVKVEAYDGNTIEIEIKKEISGRSQAEVKQGMDDIQVLFSEGEDYAMARMSSMQSRYKDMDDPLSCQRDWNESSRRIRYRYRMDFKVKVPRKISVKISTVNDGDLIINGSEGEIYANNVNGDVELFGLKDNTKAHTVNGDIEVSYLNMPSEFGDFETINGDIEIFAPAKPNAVFSFNTKYGEVYSDFDFDKKLAPQMVSNKSRGGIKYKISGANRYQLGNGGPSMEFETLNGNVLIRKGK